MSTSQLQTNESLIKEILEAPLGTIKSKLEKHLKFKLKLDLIEQNILNSKFERKITITAENLPIIRATVKFDKKILPKQIFDQLLQKKNLVGTILALNHIPNQKDILVQKINQGKVITRTYQIKHNRSVYFHVTEEIRLEYIDIIRKLQKQI